MVVFSKTFCFTTDEQGMGRYTREGGSQQYWQRRDEPRAALREVWLVITLVFFLPTSTNYVQIFVILNLVLHYHGGHCQDGEYDVDGFGDASGVVRVDVRLIRGILVTSSHLGLLQHPPAGAQPKAHIWPPTVRFKDLLASTIPPSFARELKISWAVIFVLNGFYVTHHIFC